LTKKWKTGTLYITDLVGYLYSAGVLVSHRCGNHTDALTHREENLMSPRVTPENRIPDIIRAAIAVFGHKGYRLAQMDEIAREADISKATLYYYFKSKLHLFYYILVAGTEDEETAPPRRNP
jgi:hypothetical protein